MSDKAGSTAGRRTMSGYTTRPKGKKERVSLIAAASPYGVMAEQALVISDTVNKNAFLAFLEALLPTLT